MRASISLLAGHSKWAKIARGKGATDAARALLFTKLSKGISAAARSNPDPTSNLRLAAALEAARKAACPKDVVERALAKRDAPASALTEGLLEATGPGGASLLVATLSDNMRRTLPEIRYLLGKHGGEVGTAGSQAFRFATRGLLRVAPPPSAAGGGAGAAGWEEALLEAALASGAEDVEPGGGGDGEAAGEAEEAAVWCAPGALAEVRKGLAGGGFSVASAALTRVAVSTVQLVAGSEEEAALQGLLGALEEHADVQDVVHNAELVEDEETRSETRGGGCV